MSNNPAEMNVAFINCSACADPDCLKNGCRANRSSPSPAADEAGLVEAIAKIIDPEAFEKIEVARKENFGSWVEVWERRIEAARTKARAILPLIRAEVERERAECAKVAESRFSTVRGFAVQDRQLCEDIATAIRDRASLAGDK